jgi:hypothetical protein
MDSPIFSFPVTVMARTSSMPVVATIRSYGGKSDADAAKYGNTLYDDAGDANLYGDGGKASVARREGKHDDLS